MLSNISLATTTNLSEPTKSSSYNEQFNFQQRT